MQAAIFLDRDGVLIENRSNYVRSWDDVLIYDHTLPVLAKISSTPYKIVIVTNQSAVGRGILPLRDAEEINERLVEVIIKAGGRIDGVFMCPHAPEDHCECRKPKPGLLYKAAQALSIDLPRSIMIGDALTDLMAGQQAGLMTRILLMTGRGREQFSSSSSIKLEPFLVYKTLAEALQDLNP
jgi:D-glycero-D-manno-heptose 1,7-bisphosphate phosphatase